MTSLSTQLRISAKKTRDDHTLLLNAAFALENGLSLERVQVRYQAYGTLNPARSNTVLVCHAMTGNSHAWQPPNAATPGWWQDLIGPGKALDTDCFFILCPDVLGGAGGTTGPLSLDPKTGVAYAGTFPEISLRDMVRLQKHFIDALDIAHLSAVVGGSLGGMQALEWGAIYGGFVDAIIPICTAAKQNAWPIAMNELSRLAITSDPQWQHGAYQQQPAQGLALARMIAMLSYRNAEHCDNRFGRAPASRQPQHYFTDAFSGESTFAVSQYLRHHGHKFIKRFDANAYLTISRAMDTYDLSSGRGSVAFVLAQMEPRVLMIGVASDLLYPPDKQRWIAEQVPNGQYLEIDSDLGHDAFLVEFEQLNRFIRPFLHGLINPAQAIAQ